ncbi:dipeptidase [Candidatus Palauibacter sp.]|uniref:dipeptidase n=1 Tax=Candidatus Palauibacter sp. TaxID=3101350 RepID=UPI003AF208E2
MQVSVRSALRVLSPALAAGFVALMLAAPGLRAQDEHLEIARRVLSSVPMFDGHNDLPWAIRNADPPMDVRAYDISKPTQGHTDLARLRAGGVGAQFWSVYVPASVMEEGGGARMQLEQIDIAHQIISDHREDLGLALTAAEVMDQFHRGKVASMLGIEGGHAIENSLGALRAFYHLGVRYMTLTHSANIDWADSCCEPAEFGGLTTFGEEVVREMNWLGMLVDISHVSPESMHGALDVAEAPVIFSHSSARAVTDHPRNVPDDVLRRLPENGGVVMVTFVESFVNQAVADYSGPPEGRPRATMADVVAHIEHVRAVAGIEHAAIGGDFDGIDRGPVGLEDVSTYPALFAELSRRGWTESELRALAADNLLRVMRASEATARRLQAERGPSTATIQGLDGLVP